MLQGLTDGVFLSRWWREHNTNHDNNTTKRQQLFSEQSDRDKDHFRKCSQEHREGS